MSRPTPLAGIDRAVRAAAAGLPEVIFRTIEDSMRIVGMAAAMKFMQQTRRGGRGNLPLASKAPVLSDRLSWRTGNLARSLTRPDHPNAIGPMVRVAGTGVYEGTFGTSVPYAAIHELGGIIPSRVVRITEPMRRFFWAKFYQTHDERWKWAALKRRPPTVTIPAVQMRPRPFLGPATRDEQTKGAIIALLEKRIPQTVLVSMSRALELRAGGGGS